MIDSYITSQSRKRLINSLCVLSETTHTHIHTHISKTIPRKTISSNGNTLKDSQWSIVHQKLEVRGLGIKYTRVRQNVQNPHLTPFRRPTEKEDYEDPMLKTIKSSLPSRSRTQSMLSTSGYTHPYVHWWKITCLK